MIGPGGTEYPECGEIVPIEKIVSTGEFGYGFDEIEAMENIDLPERMIATALFDDPEQRTRLTIVVSHPTVEDRQKHEAMGVIAG